MFAKVYLDILGKTKILGRLSKLILYEIIIYDQQVSLYLKRILTDFAFTSTIMFNSSGSIVVFDMMIISKKILILYYSQNKNNLLSSLFNYFYSNHLLD